MCIAHGGNPCMMPLLMAQPKIIQGGMGVAVSNWTLARTVSQMGHLGVVSGTALAAVVARRLQQGDVGGHIRRALDHFPFREMAKRVCDQYFIEGGKQPGQPFKHVPFYVQKSPQPLIELTVIGNFVEVFLAKEGHDGLVGINFLEKIQLPTVPSIYGALLAGVDYVIVGAGIPRAIPGILDQLSAGKPAQLRLDVEGALPGEEYFATFDPSEFIGGAAPSLRRPQFLAIVSSATLAMTLAKKASGRVDGFIVEGSIAGGHNAPPRGPLQLSEAGEPVYGPRDPADLGKIKELGLPFWLAGGYGRPNRLAEALALGAAGIQIGTAFAFCEESGIDPVLKQYVIDECLAGHIGVFTDPLASPTGFPFKVVKLDGTLYEDRVYAARNRICDLGYLRSPYRKTDGTLGYRCASEVLEHFVAKGGDSSATVGRKCLCNGLLATVSIGQLCADGSIEKPILTAGDDITTLAGFIKEGAKSYTAADVVRLAGL